MKHNQVIKLLLDRLGMDFLKFNETFVENTLQKRITEKECNSEDDYYNLLEHNEVEVSQFSDSLHISYSEFFRNPLTFAVLGKIIFPAILNKKENLKHKEIRIWSAASAGGQETYSLAMLLKEMNNGEFKKVDYRIFSTDYCQSQVDEAQLGQYSTSALKNINLKQFNKWFTKEGNSYSIKTELKENIDFSVFDLFNDEYSSPPTSIFGDFDLVFCANLLFYFKPEYQKKILDKACKSLVTGGYLVVGETERDILMQYNFEEVYAQSAIFRRII